MTSTDNNLLTGRRVVIVIGLVCISLVSGLGTAFWSVTSAMSGKPTGRVSNENTGYYGPIKDGEVWFVVDTLEPMRGHRLKSSRIKRLNLETGIDSETGLTLDGESGTPLWDGDDLYLVTEKSIYRAVDKKLVLIAPTISNPSSFTISPFLYDGQITTVRCNEDQSFCLAHLIDGAWTDGRPIVLPGLGRVWYDDPQRQYKTLLPLTSEQLPPKAVRRNRSVLEVIVWHEQVYLNFSNLGSFAAYRIGFEFSDEFQDSASAVAPENAPPEANGWQPIENAEVDVGWSGMAVDDAGLLFDVILRRPRHLVRRHLDGRWERLNELFPRNREIPNLAVDSQAGTSYVVYWNDVTNTVHVCRIKGNQVQRPHVIKGPRFEYLNRWKRLTVAVFLAWFIHVAILACGFAWMTRGEEKNTYDFARQHVELASFGRRSIAMIVDLALILVATLALWKVGIVSEPTTRKWSADQFAYWLLEIERLLEARLSNLAKGRWNFAFSPLEPGYLWYQALQEFLQHGWMLIIPPLVLGILKVFVEGRYGITPGKWLVGICTIRSTLRPCGFARSLVRSVLFCVDAPFALTPIPAAVSMLLSERWQRLGDRVADTIVIRLASIREARLEADSAV